MSLNINWWSIEVGEAESAAVSAAISKRCIAQGSVTEEFEANLAKFLGVPYCVCTPNGTQALSLAYMALGLGEGGEIITSNRTFVATAHAAMILGARVRALEVKDNQTLDETLLESAITPHTKAIVPVHMNGVASNMDRILEIAKHHRIEVLEDACQAFGSRDSKGRLLGTMGRFGCFSLGLAKILTTGQGGFVAAHSQEDYDLLRKLRNQGVFDVRSGDRSFNLMAYNFKFNDIQSSIGIEQLKKIKEKMSHCIALYREYEKYLGGKVPLLKSNVDSGEVPMRVIIMTPKNTALKEFLQSKGVGTSYESVSLNTVKHLNIHGSFPKSDYFNTQMLILPSGPNQPLENAKIVSELVLEFLA